MAFKSTIEIAETKSCRRYNGGRYGASSGVRMSCTTSSKNKKYGPAYQICLTIYNHTVQEARLIPGDRVDVLFDPDDKIGLIKRVQSKGYKLTKPGGSAKSKNLTLKFTWKDGMPSIAESKQLENVVVGSEGIMFKFPDQTSFGQFVGSN